MIKGVKWGKLVLIKNNPCLHTPIIMTNYIITILYALQYDGMAGQFPRSLIFRKWITNAVGSVILKAVFGIRPGFGFIRVAK